MARLRTGNNRRRAKELKQGGLFTLRYRPAGPLIWGNNQPIAIDELVIVRFNVSDPGYFRRPPEDAQ